MDTYFYKRIHKYFITIAVLLVLGISELFGHAQLLHSSSTNQSNLAHLVDQLETKLVKQEVFLEEYINQIKFDELFNDSEKIEIRKVLKDLFRLFLFSADEGNEEVIFFPAKNYLRVYVIEDSLEYSFFSEPSQLYLERGATNITLAHELGHYISESFYISDPRGVLGNVISTIYRNQKAKGIAEKNGVFLAQLVKSKRISEKEAGKILFEAWYFGKSAEFDNELDLLRRAFRNKKSALDREWVDEDYNMGLFIGQFVLEMNRYDRVESFRYLLRFVKKKVDYSLTTDSISRVALRNTYGYFLIKKLTLIIFFYIGHQLISKETEKISAWFLYLHLLLDSLFISLYWLPSVQQLGLKLAFRKFITDVKSVGFIELVLVSFLTSILITDLFFIRKEAFSYKLVYILIYFSLAYLEDIFASLFTLTEYRRQSVKESFSLPELKENEFKSSQSDSFFPKASVNEYEIIASYKSIRLQEYEQLSLYKAA